MVFPPVTLADWRALVDRELAGKPFDKVLVHETPEGIPVAPLATTLPAALPALAPPTARFQVCLRHEAGASLDELEADVADGTDALWLPLSIAALDRPALAGTFFVFDEGPEPPQAALARLLDGKHDGARFALNLDPLARRDRASFDALPAELSSLAGLARHVDERFAGSTSLMISSLPHHDAGADAADELAAVLATGVRYLEALREGGLSIAEAARQIALQVAVGRDTFTELCKLRALRIVWQKLLAASGASGAPRARVHAVSSTRTLTVRDPWVNMLRVTTQVFAAVLGGADLVTPAAFDQEFGSPSALGRRVARNTGLVLREESGLGLVHDPAGGSYHFETLTDALAREGWRRFQAIEREGGIVAALTSGRLAARYAAAWAKREKQIATRRLPILGVSEFANLDETLPRPVPPAQATHGGLPVHRDADAFEALRARAEARSPAALLVTLGSFAESRARVGFASSFLAAGGIRSRETTADERADIACLCGPDEVYATEAAARARALKAAGCRRVLLAGRPGALEPALREAGVDGFIYVGCDAVETLGQLLETA